MRRIKHVVLCLSFSFFLLAALPCAGLKAAPSEARVALEETITRVFNQLKKPEMQHPSTRGAVLAEVEKIIRGLFNFPELSMRTVGPKWKSFSDGQKKDFMDAFEDLLRARYLDKLEGYNGEKVSYTGETRSAKGDKVEIQTEVHIKDKIVPVAYRMLKNGRWTVYDIIIEGVSMVQNYRSQFQSVLDKDDAGELIRLVRQKAIETRTQKDKG
ncbi:MAG: ABC transporter substrate-binding protein [Desulfovibrio sp.]|jgi:phospholipid transport system substrate-binding protein|nr:ABC transporter substrate-binding protein [Desulfovibrio sp.]